MAMDPATGMRLCMIVSWSPGLSCSSSRSLLRKPTGGRGGSRVEYLEIFDQGRPFVLAAARIGGGNEMKSTGKLWQAERRAWALPIAKCWASLARAGRGSQREAPANAVAKLEADGVEACRKTVDIADRASSTSSRPMQPDCAVGNVVNAAGVDTGGGDLIVKVNMVGTINFVEAFLPYLEEGSVFGELLSITDTSVQPTPEEREIWDDPNNPAFFDKVKAAIDAGEVPEAMRAMGEDYQYYPIFKTTQYYTRANTRRFGKKGCRIFSIAPGALTHPCCARPGGDGCLYRTCTAFGRLGEILMRWPSSSCACRTRFEYLTGVDLILDGGKFGMTMAKQLD